MTRLRYLTDKTPGFTRRKRGKNFAYFDVRGRLIKTPSELERIRRLVIPPAWTQVWISPIAQSHLQATGRDDRNRKQYLYHPEWRQQRETTKFDRLLEFAEWLPRFRRRIRTDLARKKLGRRKILATTSALLDRTLIRVGNIEYLVQNGSYGLTTLRNRHVKIRGSLLEFSFRGKSGKQHSIQLNHARLARIVKRCQELPGQELFQYVDAAGHRHKVDSQDLNRYLQHGSHESFSAKDFRTWHGSVEALHALQKLPKSKAAATTQENLVSVTRQVAQILGNTPAVCRRSYIHPAIFIAYQEGTLHSIRPARISGLSQSERLAYGFLRRTRRQTKVKPRVRKRTRSGKCHA